ncbi:MAG: hypothetical protein GX844_07720 [Alcaligenaceae bacterium]|jgi:hypothetical protein|nr:hypothetical protein [Alcaligenaceae bacterium]
MTKKSILVGAYGQIILKEELLKHLKVKPGEELSYKLLPGNKLLLEGVADVQKRQQGKHKCNSSVFELADLSVKEIFYYPNNYKNLNKNLLH